MSPEIASALRTLLIAAGGFAIGKGWVDVAGLEIIAGGLVALAAGAWGVWAKRPRSKEAKQVARKVRQS